MNIVHLDLADLSSVKKCAAQLSQQEPFDVLINNAGKAKAGQRGGSAVSAVLRDCRSGAEAGV